MIPNQPLRRLQRRRQRLLRRHRRCLQRHRHRDDRRFWRQWRRQLWPLWRRVRSRLPLGLRGPVGEWIGRHLQRRDYQALVRLYLILLPLEDERWSRECESILERHP